MRTCSMLGYGAEGGGSHPAYVQIQICTIRMNCTSFVARGWFGLGPIASRRTTNVQPAACVKAKHSSTRTLGRWLWIPSRKKIKHCFMDPGTHHR